MFELMIEHSEHFAFAFLLVLYDRERKAIDPIPIAQDMPMLTDPNYRDRDSSSSRIANLNLFFSNNFKCCTLYNLPKGKHLV